MYNAIVNWYTIHKRDLLFREYSDPYAVWVSEIMAQQTKIDTMLPYFKRWMETFPTIESCANASESYVLKVWEGLGYYRRAKLLQKGCQHILSNHAGIFPKNYNDILSIPGIGEYTAAAIYSIVFNGKKAAVDGNVIRIVARVHEIDSDSTNTKTKKEITEIVNSWMDECTQCNFSDFTQGLMEIGALICTPKKPNCSLCPLKDACSAFSSGTQLNYPIRPSKKKSPIFKFDVLIVQHKEKLLISEDWSDGLMVGLARLPQIPHDNLNQFHVIRKTGETKHVFSHKVWNLTFYQAALKEGFSIPNDWRWLDIAKIKSLPFITAHKKIINELTS